MTTKLRARLTAAGIQQRQVCEWTGVRKNQVSWWASGQREIPMRHVVTLCRQLHCNPRDLVGWE